MITASELERELQELLRVAYRLMPPLNHRPHLFHDQKDGLCRAIVALLDQVRGAKAPEHALRSAQHVACGSHIRDARGRSVAVERR